MRLPSSRQRAPLFNVTLTSTHTGKGYQIFGVSDFQQLSFHTQRLSAFQSSQSSHRRAASSTTRHVQHRAALWNVTEKRFHFGHSHSHDKDDPFGDSHGHSHSHGVIGLDGEHSAFQQKISSEDAKASDRITWIGIYVNIVLSGLKGVAGVTFHSSGLLADAVHSASDLVSDGITLLTLKYCMKPPDQFQPYGYGKYETIGALSVAMLLVSGSLGIMMHSFDTLMVLLQSSTATALSSGPSSSPEAMASLALDSNRMGEAVQAMVPYSADYHHHSAEEFTIHPAAFVIASASVIAKEALYRATISVGKRINSSVLIANAWHHRSDAVTSVVAMAGIGLSIAGLPMFDPIAGILVGGIILKMGGEIGWDAVKELCDAQLPTKFVQKLEKAVDSVVQESNGEIVSVKRLRSRRIGRNIHVDLTLVIRGDNDGDESVSFQQACEWKQRVKESIQKDLPRVKDIIVELSTPQQSPSIMMENEYIEDKETNVRSYGSHNHSHSHGGSHHHH